MAGEAEGFTFEVEHVGIDADFHHPGGRDLKLAPCVVEAFENAREDADIFVQNASGTAFSCSEMLNWFLLQSRTTIADHLPHDTLRAGRVLLTVPIRFARGMFHMNTQAGNTDLSTLKLMVKVTVRQSRS